MSKKIEDYLHLYIGCQCIHYGEVDETKKLTGISFDDTQRVLWAYFENEENCYAPASEVKPILRRLDGMTEEEARQSDIQFYQIVVSLFSGVHLHHMFTPAQFQFLLSKGFDLFGLIDAGLAIDAATLKPQS